MAQTERLWSAAIETNLADNTEGAISPQDLRDAFASIAGYGSMLLTRVNAPQTLADVSTSYVLVDVFDTVASQSSTVNTSGVVVDATTNYRITFTAGGVYHVSFFASFTTTNNNQDVIFSPFVSGSQGLIEIYRKVGTGSDKGSVAADGVISYTAGQYLDLRVKLSTGTSDVQFYAVGLNARRVG